MLAVCLAASLAPCLSPSEARADDSANEADLQFEIGTEAYLKGDFRSALEHFLASNRLVANPNVVFNIAKSYEQLKRYSEAYSYYSDGLERDPDGKRKRAIEDALARIAPQVAVIEVTSSPPGATIYLGRRDLGARGSTPKRLAVAAGTQKILLDLPGHEPLEQTLDNVKIGTERAVRGALVPIVGSVRIDTEPFVETRVDSPDGPVVARGKASVPVPPGRRTLYFTAEGYDPTETTLEVVRDAEITTRPRLRRQQGSLVVKTDVRDAAIIIDGRVAGFTPSVVPVAVGQHEIRVALPGFRPVVRTVTVRPNTQETLDLPLQQDEVSAVSRLAESLEEAPSSVSVVSAREIAGMRYPSIAEAVRGVRGVYLTDDRSYTFVGIRGLSRTSDYGNKVLILQDGHPLNDDIVGQSFPGFEGRTDLDDVERIEVVRGPGSVLYGTGAFFGVINLVTRRKDAPSLKEVSVSAVDYGMIRGRATIQERISDKTSVWTSVSAGRAQGRAFDFPENRDASGRSGRVNPAADSWDSATLNGRLTHGAFTLQWFASRRNKRLPTGEADSSPGSEDGSFDDTRGTLEARYEPRIGASVTSLTRAHANIYLFRATSESPAEAGGDYRERYEGRWGGFEQRFVLTPLDALRLTVGGEVQRHVTATLSGGDSSGTALDASRPYSVLAGYALADAKLHSRVKVTAGARYDYVSTSTGSLNPRLAFVLSPYDAGTVKLMGGRAFRAPSVYELVYYSSTQRPAASLSPETVYSGELEWGNRLGKGWSTIMASYVNYVQGLVVTGGRGTEADPLFFRNSPVPVRTIGAEAELRRDFRDGFLLTATYSLQRTTYVSDGGALREVPNSPTQLASVRAGFPILAKTLQGMTRISVESGRWDRHEAADDPEPQRKTSGAVLWDLMVTGETERAAFLYGFGVYNIGDYRYSAPVSPEFRQRTIPQNGRTIMATLAGRL